MEDDGAELGVMADVGTWLPDGTGVGDAGIHTRSDVAVPGWASTSVAPQVVHAVHVPDPGVAAKYPSIQSVHVVPSAVEDFPALHALQDEASAAPL